MALRHASVEDKNSSSTGRAISVLLVLLGAFALLSESYVWAANPDQEEGIVQDEGQKLELEQDLKKVDWWKKTNFYYIYLRSFKDSNGDGNGDLQGLIQQLGYLKTIEVGTIILSPFYKTPNKYGGYEIQDYTAIDALYGDMTDFERLIKELNERGIRLVIEFVLNHSSKEHKWFKCSERALLEPEKCGKYKNYYVWSPSKRFNDKYPSNWRTVFNTESAWTWSDTRQEFYLHQFSSAEPELNLRNKDVLDEFKRIALFWLSKGVHGLRVIGMNYLVEDADLTDEPVKAQLIGNGARFVLEHRYTVHQNESADIVGELYDYVKEKFPEDDKVILSDAYDQSAKYLEYYGKTHSNSFTDLQSNNALLDLVETILNPERVKDIVQSWLTPLMALKRPEDRGAPSPLYLWMIGSPDISRIVDRVGFKNMLLMEILAYILPGVPINYYGDELPLHNTDSFSGKIPQKTLDEGDPSRLAYRAPMAWTADEVAAGFSSSKDIWVPQNANWRTKHVDHLLSLKSHHKNPLKQFQRLQVLRNGNMGLFVFGDLVFFDQREASVMAIARTHKKFGNILMLANLDPRKSVRVNLIPTKSLINGEVFKPPKQARVVLSNYLESRNRSDFEYDEFVNVENILLMPSQVVLLKYNENNENSLAKEPLKKNCSSMYVFKKCFGF